MSDIDNAIQTAMVNAEQLIGRANIKLAECIVDYWNSLRGIPEEIVEQRVSNYYHPSELSICVLMAYHRRIGTKFIYRTSVNTRLVFDLGKAIHKMIQKHYLPKIFDDVAVEVPVVVEDLHYCGSADAVVTLDKNTKFVIEIKSRNSLANLSSPDREHLLQLHYYMYGLSIPNGCILYVGKADASVKSFNVHFRHDIFQECLNRIRIAEMCVGTSETPPPEPSYRCSECGVNHICSRPNNDTFIFANIGDCNE